MPFPPNRHLTIVGWYTILARHWVSLSKGPQLWRVPQNSAQDLVHRCCGVCDHFSPIPQTHEVFRRLLLDDISLNKRTRSTTDELVTISEFVLNFHYFVHYDSLFVRISGTTIWSSLGRHLPEEDDTRYLPAISEHIAKTLREVGVQASMRVISTLQSMLVTKQPEKPRINSADSTTLRALVKQLHCEGTSEGTPPRGKTMRCRALRNCPTHYRRRLQFQNGRHEDYRGRRIVKEALWTFVSFSHLWLWILYIFILFKGSSLFP